jgi:ferredoxin
LFKKRILDRPFVNTGTAFIGMDTSRCKACWKCIEACPKGIIARINIPFHKHARFLSTEECEGCLKCVKACANGAITPLREAAYSKEK